MDSGIGVNTFYRFRIMEGKWSARENRNHHINSNFIGRSWNSLPFEMVY